MSVKIESIINEHTKKIISGKFSEPESLCPRCLNQPEKFKLHECRKRSFRFIVENFVKSTISLLLRWKCQLCYKTFTDYPDFALPNKRFTLPDIESVSKNYIIDANHTYQSVITYQDGTIGYQEENDNNIDRFLSSSTPWRWIDWLGRFKTCVSEATNYIAQIDGFKVPNQKFRSINRRIIIQLAHRSLLSHVLQQMGP